MIVQLKLYIACFIMSHKRTIAPEKQMLYYFLCELKYDPSMKKKIGFEILILLAVIFLNHMLWKVRTFKFESVSNKGKCHYSHYILVYRWKTLE